MYGTVTSDGNRLLPASGHSTDSSTATVMTTPGTDTAPLDAYTLHALETQKKEAVNTWGFRTKLITIVQLIVSCLIFPTAFWFANFIGFVNAILGFYGAHSKKSEFVFVYMVLCLLVFVKNIGLLIQMLGSHVVLSGYEIFIVVALFLSGLALEPVGFYFAYNLHRSLKVDVSFPQLRQST